MGGCVWEKIKRCFYLCCKIYLSFVFWGDVEDEEIFLVCKRFMHSSITGIRMPLYPDDNIKI